MFNLFRSDTPKANAAPEDLLFEDRRIQVMREAFRRQLSLRVSLNGEIQIFAAKSTRNQEILAFLEMNRSWIEIQSKKFAALRTKYPPKKYVEGEIFPFMGEPRRLHFALGDSGESSGQIFCTNENLVLQIPREYFARISPIRPQPDFAEPVREFYRRSGRALIASRLEIIAKRMQLFPKSVSYRSQKTRWGSCSSRGHLSFNWRLIVMPLDVIDYVIVHELAHLQHPNHSKNFWHLVAKYMHDYRAHRKYLREHQFISDFLGSKSYLWN